MIRTRVSFTERIAHHFRRHAGEWVNAVDLELIGGRQAWRTRVSNCRTRLGMEIHNRQRWIAPKDGRDGYTISEYRFVLVESLRESA